MQLHLFCLFLSINKAPAGARSDWDIKINYTAAKISHTNPWAKWIYISQEGAKQAAWHFPKLSCWVLNPALPCRNSTSICSTQSWPFPLVCSSCWWRYSNKLEKQDVLFTRHLGGIETAGFIIIHKTLERLKPHVCSITAAATCDTGVRK